MFNNYMQHPNGHPIAPPNFDGGPGASMEGKWIDKYTGQTVIVKNSMMDGNDILVMLSDGTIMNMKDFSRKYIQVSDEIYDNEGNIIGTEEIEFEPIHDHHVHHNHHNPFDDHKPPHKEPPCNHKPNRHPEPCIKPKPHPHPVKPPKRPPLHSCKPNPEVEARNMIDKVFKTTKPIINLNFNLESDGFPKNEIQMLTNIFGIKLEQVSKYIIEKYLSVRKINQVVTEFLAKELNETPGILFPDELDPDFSYDGEDNIPPIEPDDDLDSSMQVFPEDGDYATLPDGTAYIGEYDEQGNFNYVDDKGNQSMMVPDENEACGYAFFYWDPDGDIYQVTYTEDENGNWISDYPGVKLPSA